MNERSSRRIVLKTAPNFRDLGGLPVAGGVFRPREVYRSASLQRLSGEDSITFADLGIRVVYDLRTAGERASAPDRLPDGLTSVNLDVLGDSPLDVANKVGELAGDPSGLAAVLGDDPRALLEESYRDIVRLPSARAAYHDLFLGLADPHRRPALFHCTTGKDRTGWAAAALLMLLGAEADTVRADYLETNTDLLPSLQPLLAQVAKHGVDPDRLLPVLTVQDAYLDAAIDQMQTQFGTIEDYATAGLGLSEDVIAALRTELVEPAA